MLKLLQCLLLLILLYSGLFGSNECLKYISPVPNSARVAARTEIILRPTPEFVQQFRQDPPELIIEGNLSGTHTYNLYTSNYNQSYVYQPSGSFLPGEKVVVSSLLPLGKEGSVNYDILFEFDVTSGDLNTTINTIDLIKEEIKDTAPPKPFISTEPSFPDTLPSDMHRLIPIGKTVNTDDNFYFTGTFSFNEPYDSYIMIVDAEANPIFYRRIEGITYDFKKHKNGYLTYFDVSKTKFIILNSKYEEIGSINAGYGYNTDFHELIFDDNGHSLYLCYDKQRIDMSHYIPDGHPEANVYGLILQEKDENDVVIFQWRSWDNVGFYDAANAIDLTAKSVDYIHGNSISIDHDGHLVLSFRNFNEIMKIDRSSGETIYRLGGKHNEFTLLNDPYKFNWQHDARILENGKMTIFDNGAKRSPNFSRGLEYIVDENFKTIELTWQYNPSPKVFAGSMCNMQTLENGNRLLSWAGWARRGFTEVDEEGKSLNNYDIANAGRLYRVFKHSWQSDFISVFPKNVDFELGANSTSDTAFVTLTNNTNETIKFNNLYHSEDAFTILDEFPVSIEPRKQKKISVRFNPDKGFKVYNDTLRLCADKPGERRSVRIYLTGSEVTGIDESTVESPFSFRVNNLYPNPFNATTNISFYLSEPREVTMVVHNSTGEIVKAEPAINYSAGTQNIKLNMNSFASGVYFVTLSTETDYQCKKVLLLK